MTRRTELRHNCNRKRKSERRRRLKHVNQTSRACNVTSLVSVEKTRGDRQRERTWWFLAIQRSPRVPKETVSFYFDQRCFICSTEFAGLPWTFNHRWDIVFTVPKTAGEKIFRLWEMSSRGNKKYNNVSRGWWSANDFRLIFNIKDFVGDGTATAPGISKQWKELAGDKDEERCMFSHQNRFSSF